MGEHEIGMKAESKGMPYKDIKDVRVEDIYQLCCGSPAMVRTSQELTDVIKSMIDRPLSQKVYVVDEENKLIGTITMQTILRQVGYIYGVRQPGLMSFFKFLKEILKEDITEFMEKNPVKVTKRDKVLDALKLMVQTNLNNLPVVDENNVLIGELDGIEILKKALKA